MSALHFSGATSVREVAMVTPQAGSIRRRWREVTCGQATT